jgi:hypothetical protein
VVVSTSFAYRALAQFKTEEAIDAMIQGVLRWADSDWFEWFSTPISKIWGGNWWLGGACAREVAAKYGCYKF